MDSISRDIYMVFLAVKKKLLKVDFETVQPGITRLHFPIMRMLRESGPLPISEIGRRLLIPKPQMTYLVDQMSRSGIVERVPDEKDRRITNITLTDSGMVVLTGCLKLMRDSAREKLSTLSEDELKELSQLLKKLDRIAARLK